MEGACPIMGYSSHYGERIGNFDHSFTHWYADLNDWPLNVTCSFKEENNFLPWTNMVFYHSLGVLDQAERMSAILEQTNASKVSAPGGQLLNDEMRISILVHGLLISKNVVIHCSCIGNIHHLYTERCMVSVNAAYSGGTADCAVFCGVSPVVAHVCNASTPQWHPQLQADDTLAAATCASRPDPMSRCATWSPGARSQWRLQGARYRGHDLPHSRKIVLENWLFYHFGYLPPKALCLDPPLSSVNVNGAVMSPRSLESMLREGCWKVGETLCDPRMGPV